MKSILLGGLFGALSVGLWNLIVVLVDYFDFIQFNFYENRGMMIVVMLIIPLVLLYLLLTLMSRSKKFLIAFLSLFILLSVILMTVSS
ncbi:hypothetical protein [Planococcus lenghuensis]|uniref:Uncharacterized protein n=1 Tax=Planococcus lenghuensis TaxID=2213202 RepID=A0A1Q2L2P9_9BACL|nr:hypothetical protein [Planococcus lenghuensis]AQQ54683.1 hypothetical protein B0X71_17290 [Planococcus lenghuensis]